jgi:hypothetical protein
MSARVLPPEEWHRLKGTEAESVWMGFNPGNTRVLVVEEDGNIIGTWTMLRAMHAECIWIAPSHRGRFGVAKSLLRGMYSVAREWDVNGVITGSISEEITDLIERLGGIPMPSDSYILPVNGERSCQR